MEKSMGQIQLIGLSHLDSYGSKLGTLSQKDHNLQFHLVALGLPHIHWVDAGML